MKEGTLPQQRTQPGDLFPSPADGDRVEVNPPAFNWLPVDSLSEFRVLVESDSGEPVLDETVPHNYLILRRPLAPGRYRWDVRAGDRSRGWHTFELASDAIERVVPTADQLLAKVPDFHPRHVYYPADIPWVRAHCRPQLEALARNIDVAVAQGLPPRPAFHRAPPALARRRYGQTFRRYREYVDRNLVACALGHLFLNDTRAAEYARACLLEICDWNPEGPCAVDGPWGDEIGLSNVRCLAPVYDWTFDLYSQNEHVLIRNTIAHYARQALRRLCRLDFFSHPGNSHPGRLSAYLGQAALVLHGYLKLGEVRAWLQYAIDVYGSLFPHFGDADGGWAQGTFYAASYTKWFQPFFFAVERHSGFSFFEHPFFHRVSQYFVHFAPPGWEIHPFGDGYWIGVEDDEHPGFFAQDPYGVYAERFGPELAREFARRVATPDIYKMHLFDVLRLPFKPARPDAAGPLSPSRAFRGVGLVSMHSDIAHPEDDTAVLARASRHGTASHQHADQGSFVIISRGLGLITPSGYFGGEAHRMGWLKQSRAHNTVLINGEGQPVNSHTAVGHVEFLRERGEWCLAGLDVTRAYPGLSRFKRRILFVRPALIVVCDQIDAENPVSCTWLLHTLSPPRIRSQSGRTVALHPAARHPDTAPGRLAVTTVHVHRDPASLSLALFAAPACDLPCHVTDTFAVGVYEGVPPEFHQDYDPARDHLKNAPQYHLAWDATPQTRRRFAAVFAVNGADVCVEQDAQLAVHGAGHELRIDLPPDGPISLQLDGAAIPSETGYGTCEGRAFQ
ncbi:MAG: heparinase II/III family protein [Kiritimatiellae bacterium]|nr:heparinase II/III family protein [Kiritimatiellia bacterium]